MGGWQRDMSMRGDYSPWDNPCWNDDWEHELRENGYSTVQEWNRMGRTVKEGEKGRYLPCARVTVFRESQTVPRDPSIPLHFETYQEAVEWALENPGSSITRSPDGKGFVSK